MMAFCALWHEGYFVVRKHGQGMVGKRKVGQVTSGISSPRLKTNIGLSLIDR